MESKAVAIGKFLDGPLAGKELVHQESKSYREIDDMPSTWPVEIDPWDKKVTIHGLHKQLTAKEVEKMTKQRRYHLMYTDERGRYRGDGTPIGTYKVTGFYKLTLIDVEEGHKPSYPPSIELQQDENTKQVPKKSAPGVEELFLKGKSTKPTATFLKQDAISDKMMKELADKLKKKAYNPKEVKSANPSW